MNNEKYNQIIDEAYKNYQKEMLYHPEENWLDNGVGAKSYRQLTQEEFINKCKTDPEFSEKWGLEIVERELSLDERHQIHTDNVSKLNNRPMYVIYDGSESERDKFYDEENIPTKLITLTYKNETIEFYE